MNITWNAKAYTKDFSFVHQYGNDLIALIDCAQDQTKSVLDLGCGNGALTNRLRAQGFQVIGLDASPDLLELARKQYPGIDFLQADAASFSLKEQVDVVFPTQYFTGLTRKSSRPCWLVYIGHLSKTGNLFLSLEETATML